MDVRFSGQTLYCHISRGELARLAMGRAVELVVALPRHHTFRVNVRPSPMGADRGGWQLDSDPTGIWLTVPRAELERLGQTETFAERLVHDFPLSCENQKVQVVLEALADSQSNENIVLEITSPAE